MKCRRKAQAPAPSQYRVTHILADWVGLTSIWDVPQAVGLYCSCGAAQARQRNITNLIQPNLGPRGDGSPCIKGTKTRSKQRQPLCCDRIVVALLIINNQSKPNSLASRGIVSRVYKKGEDETISGCKKEANPILLLSSV